MGNLAQELEAAADGPILFAVIGKDGGGEPANSPLFGQCVPWPEARALLDHEYGAVDPEPGSTDELIDWATPDWAVYAWTADRVIFVHEYDGASSIVWVPRNPVPCEPEFGGTDAE